MILLTDEEIQTAMDTVPLEGFTCSYEYGQQKMEEYQSLCRKAIAKAQLQKVIDEAEPGDLSWRFRQALLEEVKECVPVVAR